MIRLSARTSLASVRSLKFAAKPRNFARIAGFGLASSVASFNSFSFNEVVATAPQIPAPVSLPQVVSSDTVESTTEFLTRRAKEIYDWLVRFFLAVKRTVVCSTVITTAAIVSPVALYFGQELFVWNYIVSSIQYLGPTFIKLAQWASSRPDLFPEDFTAHLQKLQDSTMTYPWHVAHSTMCQAFGKDYEKRIKVDRTPIGSGCIAQVYRGTLTLEDGTQQDVAIKLIHPHVRNLIAVDMDIMRFIAYVIELFPSLEYLSMSEIVEEFARNMGRQNDLTAEAKHLIKFQKNFQDNDFIVFPDPVPGYIHENALLETYLPGKSINEYMKKDVPEELKLRLVDLCAVSLLEMVFAHNFVHGDLHPGNILVQETKKGPRLVFLDCGIVTQVKKHQFRPMLDICLALLHYDGYKAGYLLADHSTRMTKEGLDNFCNGLKSLVDRARTLNYFEHLGGYVSEVCELSLKNKVKVVPEFFHTAMSIKVAEGIALCLDPSIEMAAVAIPVILKSQARYVRDKALGKHTIDDDVMIDDM